MRSQDLPAICFRNMKKVIKILCIVLSVLIVLTAAFLIYCADYSKNIDEDATKSNEYVNVIEEDYGYFFDGYGTTNAFIFYPGGKVEDIAYSSLLKMIASKGVDCYLLTMPFNLAFLNVNGANKVINNSYEHWYIGGHSLGGVAASMYAKNNISKLDGLILLASYSTKDLSNENIQVLSIYGSNDKVLNMKEYTKNIGNLPNDKIEYIIEGGNHGNFGTYGLQKGDGESSITGVKQIDITSSKIVEFILSI